MSNLSNYPGTHPNALAITRTCRYTAWVRFRVLDTLIGSELDSS